MDALSPRTRAWLAGLPEAPWRRLATLGLGAALLGLTVERLPLLTSPPSAVALALTLGVLALAWRAASPLVAAYVLLGAASLAWSLAPGHTLRAVPWEAMILAGFVVGRQRGAPWLLALPVATLGSSSLALYAFGLNRFLSGSPHYLAGAVSAVAVTLLWNPGISAGWRRGMAAGLLSGLPLYLVVVSGSRAVYLAMLAAVGLLLARVLVRRVRREIVGLAVAATIATVAAVGLDLAMPGSPATLALRGKATVEAQLGSAKEHGAGRHRLRFWVQALDVAIDHPLGAGAGSFPAVIHAHQLFPMTWSNSPHNVFFEVLANGGWLRLVLLLGVIGWAVSMALRRGDVAAAAGVLAIWIFLSLDVASYHPGILALAFLVLGIAWGPPPSRSRESSAFAGIGAATVAATALAVFLWWNAGCTSESCVLVRKLAAPSDVAAYLETLPAPQRSAFLDRVERRYPESLWVLQLREAYADGPEERLEVRSQIVRRFPLQHPHNYTRLATSALELGLEARARRALQDGVAVFPPDRRPYAEFRLSPADYDAWHEEVAGLLLALETP